MNKLFPFLGIVLVTFICACGGKPVKTKQSMIVGTWKLQTQHIGIYVNDTPQFVVNGEVGNISNPTITFNNDGSDKATSVFSISNGLISLGDNNSGYVGNYSVTDSLITMKPFFIGSLWLDTLLAPQTAISFHDQIVTETAKITELTSSLLSFDTEIVILQTADNKTRTIRTSTTYNYTR